MGDWLRWIEALFFDDSGFGSVEKLAEVSCVEWERCGRMKIAGKLYKKEERK